MTSNRGTSIQPSRPVPEKDRSTGTVLLVDDEPAVRNLAARFLSMKGFHVLSANDCSEARALWNEHKEQVDLLLTDVVMAGSRDGHELAAELQAHRPGLKILFTSGYDLQSAVQETPVTNASFIAKPYRPDQLLAAVQSALNGREPRTLESYGENSLG